MTKKNSGQREVADEVAVQEEPTTPSAEAAATPPSQGGESEDVRTDAEKIADFHASRAAEQSVSETLTAPVEEPNVVFVGKTRSPKFVDAETTPEAEPFIKREPPEFVMVPIGRKIELPAGLKHGEPFYHKDARTLIQTSPDFKKPKAKGEK